MRRKIWPDVEIECCESYSAYIFSIKPVIQSVLRQPLQARSSFAVGLRE
jgi:hypothetical protein